MNILPASGVPAKGSPALNMQGISNQQELFTDTVPKWPEITQYYKDSA